MAHIASKMWFIFGHFLRNLKGSTPILEVLQISKLFFIPERKKDPKERYKNGKFWFVFFFLSEDKNVSRIDKVNFNRFNRL